MRRADGIGARVRPARLLALGVVVCGALCVANGAWIRAKAMLAQVLIGAAWERRVASAGESRPWPWADTSPIARLTLEHAHHVDRFIVLDGASGRNLAFGPTHDPASTRPGAVGNSVIEGHRDTHFAVLRGLAVGDPVRVETPGRPDQRFLVTDIRVVDSRRTRIALWADHPRLTLVTCYPFDALVPGGPLRLVVTADPVAAGAPAT